MNEAEKQCSNCINYDKCNEYYGRCKVVAMLVDLDDCCNEFEKK
jgi:hypothetical protein